MNLSFIFLPFEDQRITLKIQNEHHIYSLNLEIISHHNAFRLWNQRSRKCFLRNLKASFFQIINIKEEFLSWQQIVWKMYFAQALIKCRLSKAFNKWMIKRSDILLTTFSTFSLIEIKENFFRTISGFQWIFYSLWAIKNKCATMKKALFCVCWEASEVWTYHLRKVWYNNRIIRKNPLGIWIWILQPSCFIPFAFLFIEDVFTEEFSHFSLQFLSARDDFIYVHSHTVYFFRRSLFRPTKRVFQRKCCSICHHSSEILTTYPFGVAILIFKKFCQLSLTKLRLLNFA